MKRKVYLKESDLHKIVRECVSRVLESESFDAKRAALSDMKSDNDEADEYNRTITPHNRKSDAVNTAIDNPNFRNTYEWMYYMDSSNKMFPNAKEKEDDREDALKHISQRKRIPRKDTKDRPWDLSSFGSGDIDASIARDVDMLSAWNNDI